MQRWHYQRGGEVSLLIDARPGGDALPRIVHFGADLGAMPDFDAIAAAAPAVMWGARMDGTCPPCVLPGAEAGYFGMPAVAGGAWPFERASGGGDSVTLHLRAGGQAVGITYRLSPQGVLAARVEGMAAAVALPLPAWAHDLISFGGDCAREFSPARQTLDNGALVFESRRGRPGHDRFPGLIVGAGGFSDDHGDVYAVTLGWSGSHRLCVERLREGGVVVQAGEINGGADGPWVYATHSPRGLNGAMQALHAFVRERIVPKTVAGDALNQFSQQTNIKLNIDSALLEGKVTQGLEGQFETKPGLDQLLLGSGLKAIQSKNDGNHYFIQIIPQTSTEPVVTTLPSIVVKANNANRYVITSTSTATKTNTLLRDVPQAISIFTNELIKDQSIRSLSDAVRYVPGVGVSQGEGNRDALVFRGNRSTGDFLIDGIRDDAEYYRDIYNTERIEVLKGANEMIFGRGGPGGVVNRISKEANWNPNKEFSFQGGSFHQKRMTADVGYVVNDMLSLRLNAVYEDAGSFRDGVNMQRLGISPTLTFKPTNRSKIVANMERFHDDRTADRGITSVIGGVGEVTGPVNVHRSQFFGDPKRSNANINVLSFNSLIEHKFESGITLQNRTNYAMYDKFYQNVFANNGLNTLSGLVSLGAYNNNTTRENVFNQTNLLYSLNTAPAKSPAPTKPDHSPDRCARPPSAS